MVEEEMKQLFVYLENISKMLGFLIIRDLKTTKEKVVQLYRIGLVSSTIADILGVSRNHVDVTLSNARKAGEIS